MESKDFTSAFLVDQSPMEAFNAINDVRGWWTEKLEGDTDKQGDEFCVQFWDVHYSKQKLIEVIPGEKVVWLVTDSKLTFLHDESEWTGMKIIFDITKQGNKTQVRFTQTGLVPEVQCYGACSNAWTGYVHGSLKALIETGEGKPTLKDE